ncbi:hypothetical protein OHO83_09175 [Streptomyces sp. NBC_00569]|uniref:hypothetical protein n=1 Tax=Streptomyces sp. NBC_00569 TaxID=2975780 RepID=UPI002E81C505|nr:hypothetical protein [Streptomyces sp. NBC_00569]WUB92471.1 hypothetical protein OHO83_09175 [Streptomyces sp. NBC_00569]
MADRVAVISGVDTHTDVHQGAVIDCMGRHLATASFPTTPDGYRLLLAWLRAHGDLQAVGVEGTGAFGACLLLSPQERHSDDWVGIRTGDSVVGCAITPGQGWLHLGDGNLMAVTVPS